MLGCIIVAIIPLVEVSAGLEGRKETVRSVDAASNDPPSHVCASATKGFSAAVRVCVHTPLSTSHVRTVESNPLLYAFCVPLTSYIALETRAVCPFNTVIGAFRRTPGSVSSPPASLLRLVVRIVSISRGTSSTVGMAVSHTPTRVSHEAVRRCVPEGEEEMEERGAVCVCNEAIAFDVESEERGNWVRRAERSCEAVASSTELGGELGDGTMQRAAMGARCACVLFVSFWEWSNERMQPSYDVVRKCLLDH